MHPNIELQQEDVVSKESSQSKQDVTSDSEENKNEIKSSELVKYPAKDILMENITKCESIYPSMGLKSSSIQNQIRSEIETPLNIEKTDNKIKAFAERTMIKSVYPDLKSIQYCEKVVDITSIQTLVKTYTEEYVYKTCMEATKRYQEFHMVC